MKRNYGLEFPSCNALVSFVESLLKISRCALLSPIAFDMEMEGISVDEIWKQTELLSSIASCVKATLIVLHDLESSASLSNYVPFVLPSPTVLLFILDRKAWNECGLASLGRPYAIAACRRVTQPPVT